MTCNEGGPTNFERDILPDYTIEEELEGTVRLGESTFFLSVASILVSNTLTRETLLEGLISPPIPQSKFTLLSSPVSQGPCPTGLPVGRLPLSSLFQERNKEHHCLGTAYPEISLWF